MDVVIDNSYDNIIRFYYYTLTNEGSNLKYRTKNIEGYNLCLDKELLFKFKPYERFNNYIKNGIIKVRIYNAKDKTNIIIDNSEEGLKIKEQGDKEKLIDFLKTIKDEDLYKMTEFQLRKIYRNNFDDLGKYNKKEYINNILEKKKEYLENKQEDIIEFNEEINNPTLIESDEVIGYEENIEENKE